MVAIVKFMEPRGQGISSRFQRQIVFEIRVVAGAQARSKFICYGAAVRRRHIIIPICLNRIGPFIRTAAYIANPPGLSAHICLI